MEGWSTALLNGVLALVALWGAMRLYGERSRPGMLFGVAALFTVFLAAIFGTFRHAGLDAVNGIDDGLSTISAIVSPSWAIAAAIFAFRGVQPEISPGGARLAVLWMVPAVVAVLAFLPPTMLLGQVYAQIAGLAMLCVLVGAGVIAAIKGRAWPGAALAIAAAGYAMASLAMLGVFGNTEVAMLGAFQTGMTVWAGAFAWGLPGAARAQ